MNEEWKKVTDHRALLAQIKPIKQGFLEQMQIKWGMQYTFEEYIRLEDIYTNTIRRAGITNPLTMDIVKKIAVVSVGMDKALTEGEIKSAAEYSKMHKQLTDSAGLDKLIEVGSTDTINNVSDLCDYLEREGFQFNCSLFANLRNFRKGKILVVIELVELFLTVGEELTVKVIEHGHAKRLVFHGKVLLRSNLL